MADKVKYTGNQMDTALNCKNEYANMYLTFLFPVFLMLSVPFGAAALFDRDPTWKPVSHNDSTTLADIEKTVGS